MLLPFPSSCFGGSCRFKSLKAGQAWRSLPHLKMKESKQHESTRWMRRLRQLNTSFPESFTIDHIWKVIKYWFNFSIMHFFFFLVCSLKPFWAVPNQTGRFYSDLLVSPFLRPPQWMTQDLSHPRQPLSILQVCGFTINMNMMWQTWRRGQRWQTGRYSNFHPAELSFFFFFSLTQHWVKLKKKKRNFSSNFNFRCKSFLRCPTQPVL